MTQPQTYYQQGLAKGLLGFLCFLLLGINLPLNAQPVLDARNVALGGGGTAYLSGIEANFYNPANLAVYDREGTLHLGFGTLGTFFEPVLSSGNPRNQFERYTDTFLPYSPGSLTISPTDREALLEENYSGNESRSEHLSRADMLWGGAVWKKGNTALSLALRTRAGSRINVGKGWYSTESISQDSIRFRDFTLVKELQVLHEISLGFAQEFEFFNGLMPRISKLFIGIAPKLVIGGAYENSFYEAQYTLSSVPDEGTYSRTFDLKSAGNNSKMLNSYLLTRDPQTAIDQELDNRSLTDPTGFGGGIDFGLTYIIPLGTEVTLLDEGENRRPLEKSLRIGFSITNIGVIRYSKSPFQLQSEPSTSTIQSQNPLNSRFVGSAGQVPVFFEEATNIPNPLLEAESRSDESFTTSLPASLNTGAVLDLKRFKLMGDLTLGLNNTAFTNKKLVGRFGLETRPLPYLPIRLGTALAAGKPLRIGAGTGIETRYWDFSISTQLLVKSSTLTTDVVGGALAGLQFHL